MEMAKLDDGLERDNMYKMNGNIITEFRHHVVIVFEDFNDKIGINCSKL